MVLLVILCCILIGMAFHLKIFLIKYCSQNLEPIKVKLNSTADIPTETIVANNVDAEKIVYLDDKIHALESELR